MIRLLALCLALVWPAVLPAQPVRVLSGDHPGFARLVLGIVPGSDWRVGRTGAGYRIAVEGAEGFDISGVFDRIGRERIADLRSGPAGLDLDLACDCHLMAFLHRPEFLVLDVRPGPPPADSPWEGTAETGIPYRPSSSITGQVPLFATGPLADLLAPPAPGPVTPAEGAPPPAEPAARPEPPGPEPGPVPPSDQDLLARVLDAAGQGLLDPAIEIDPPAPEQAPPPSPPPDPAPPSPAPQDPPASPGIAARTALEQALQAGADDGPEHCLPRQSVDVAAWAAGPDFASATGALRAGLTTESGNLSEDTVLALARAYVAYGFGAEALGILALDGAQTADRRIVADLARIVDGATVPQSPLASQPGCPGDIGLWSALATGSLVPRTAQERTGVLMAFRALPEVLRDQLAARVADLFLAAGDAGAAAQILSGFGPPPQSAAVPLPERAAAIALATEGPEAAIATLDEAAQTDPRLSAEALLQLVELRLAEGGIVPPDQIALANALRFEYRGRPEAPLLFAAELRGHLSNDDFPAALALLGQEGPGQPPDLVARLSEELVLRATARMADGAFAEFAFGALPADPGPEGGNALAERLLSLGFPDRALEVVAPSVQGPAMAQRRFLRAEALLALGRGAAAMAVVGGMPGPRAAALRRDALLQQGRPAEAAAAASLLDPDAAGTAIDWQAGDWAAMLAAEDPLLVAAATARSFSPALDPNLPELAARARLIEDSAATRALAEQLLSGFPLPEGDRNGSETNRP